MRCRKVSCSIHTNTHTQSKLKEFDFHADACSFSIYADTKTVHQTISDSQQPFNVSSMICVSSLKMCKEVNLNIDQ